MPSRSEIAYFGAGPAPLPTNVLEDASKAILNYKDSGMGIVEISHRSADAAAILESTQSALRQLLDIPSGDGPDGYQVIFLQGGGSGEFSASVYHMVGVWVERKRQAIIDELGTAASEEDVFSRLKSAIDNDMKLDYLVTGSWSLKASQEAARLVGSGPVNVAVDARRNGKFGAIPQEAEWKLTSKPANSAMVYFCDNETVDGVEFPAFPSVLEDPSRLVVADMSSNFLSRAVDVKKYSAIFGGAQKNIGSAGITIAIVKNSIMPPHAPQAKADLLRKLNLPVGPIVLDWPTIAKNNSLYNTLPILDVWIAGQVMEGLLARHPAAEAVRIQGQQEEAELKAKLVYEVLDKHSNVYHVVPDKSARSRMNICFRIGSDADRDATEKEFLAKAAERKLLGLKGHRSVGGIRASNYNAVSVENTKKLVSLLNDFATERS